MATDLLARIGTLVDELLAEGSREDVIRLLALMAGRFVLVKERARQLRHRDDHSTLRTISVAAALMKYPVISRTFLYERGEALGITRRLALTRKLVVDEGALLAFLQGRER